MVSMTFGSSPLVTFHLLVALHGSSTLETLHPFSDCLTSGDCPTFDGLSTSYVCFLFGDYSMFCPYSSTDGLSASGDRSTSNNHLASNGHSTFSSHLSNKYSSLDDCSSSSDHSASQWPFNFAKSSIVAISVIACVHATPSTYH
eukprot:Gb_05202 [translate_table: standard]